MDTIDGQIRFSANDLVNHLACRRLTELNNEVASGIRVAPGGWDPELALLRERGLAHEQAYIEHLKDQGEQVTIIEGVGVDDGSFADTMAAMRASDQVIYQAALRHGSFAGRADILRRVDVPSALGEWSYEVTDTKLARDTRSGTILQLSLYSDLIGALQGELPEFMYVVAPWTEFEPQQYRTSDYAAYYRFIRRWLERSVDGTGMTGVYPDPKEHCGVCRWSDQCSRRRREDDHLCLVAGISTSQITELTERAIDHTARLATEPLPITWQPKRGAQSGYARVREQARLQVESRGKDIPLYEILPPEPETGLALLPEPTVADIFLDLEGDPFVGRAGLEYLIGYLTVDENGQEHYSALWAFDQEAEKRNFEEFVDWVMKRWEESPDMHIYHFAPYEPGAFKRLMCRYATREEEVDRMLRAGLFVDLYRVVRGGLRAGVESYSIKELEQFFGFTREVSLSAANSALFALSRALEFGDPDAIEGTDMEAVAGYNRDDCASTLHLRDWLEGIRGCLVAEGETIERPVSDDGAASEEISERQRMIQALADRIAGDVDPWEDDKDSQQYGRWVLANILDWHRREEKATWWEYFRLSELSVEELSNERAALAGLEFVGKIDDPGRTPVHRYRFPVQETNMRASQNLRAAGGDSLGTLVSLDAESYTIDIKKLGRTADVHPPAVFAHDRVDPKVLQEALLRLGQYVADQGITGNGPYRAARELLQRKAPSLGGEPIRATGETALDAALRIAGKGDFGVLPIQGPPGTGKTYTAARMICELVRKGRRVGITANSHKVIANLLDEVMSAAEVSSLDLRAVRKISSDPEDAAPKGVTLTKDNGQVFQELAGSCQVGAGTAWLWARPEAMDAVDVLFVDEAAQMSLANVLAVSHAGPNLVLVGDPQQLDQPTQGVHPEGTDGSALGHLLGDRQTISEDQGLFLEETWRLHPDVCAFTSEVFYEDKLVVRPGLNRQHIVSSGPLTGTGLRFVPVSHRGNQSSAAEEVDAVASLVHKLTDGASRWIDRYGLEHTIGLDDVLIIAPYNAQVFKMQERLPGANVGTVDKFQGQEAPVVIYSMATSAPEEAPHGMEFLYSLNRLNVATSRARCVCILVGSPDLFTPECRSPRQMRLGNAFCRYRELATTVEI